MLSYVVAFVVLLSLLIFVHELGHFLVARWCGVRVLKFSIGFGPPIGFGRYRLAWTRGDTEWVIAWIPLGGFVKMLGENPEDSDDPEAIHHPEESLSEKNTWQKLAVVFAGPIANLILPVAVFVIALAIGMPRPAPVVGSVEPESPAAMAGLQVDDRLLSVDGEPVAFWGDVEGVLRDRPGESVPLRYERGGEERSAELVPAGRPSVDEFGKVQTVGWSGLGHRRLSGLLGVSSADSPAHAAGLRSGEVVEQVGDTPVEDWLEFAAAYAAAGREGSVTLTLVKGSSEEDLTRRQLEVPALGDLDRLGVTPAAVLIGEVTPDSAAEEAGFQAGDLLLSVDGRTVGSFDRFAETVRSSEGRALNIGFARDGELRQLSVAPRLVPYDAGFGIEEPRYLIGIAPLVATLPGEVGLDRERNPLVAVPRAVGMTVEVTHTFLRGLGKLISGEVSRKQLAGPIGIARIAGTAFERGWEEYLFVLVLISINLGILNLLPIPVLDGGQALIFAVEGLRGSRLSLRSREIVAQIGVAVLMLLMGLALWNDVTREWARLMERLSG